MIFAHTIDKVLSRQKRQTRRLVKPGEELIEPAFPPFSYIKYVKNGKDRIRYMEGCSYAVQRGRGIKAEGRIEITGIRMEDVRNISDEDVKAEGFHERWDFWWTWVCMHDVLATDRLKQIHILETSANSEKVTADYLASRPAERYQAWVLEFSLVEAKKAA